MRRSSWPDGFSRTRSSAPTPDFLAPTGVVAPGFKPVRSERADGGGRWVAWPARVAHTIGALEPPTTGPGPVAQGGGRDGRGAHAQSRRGGRDRAGRAGGHQVPRPAGGVRPAPTPAGAPPPWERPGAAGGL